MDCLCVRQHWVDEGRKDGGDAMWIGSQLESPSPSERPLSESMAFSIAAAFAFKVGAAMVHISCRCFERLTLSCLRLAAADCKSRGSDGGIQPRKCEKRRVFDSTNKQCIKIDRHSRSTLYSQIKVDFCFTDSKKFNRSKDG